MQNASQKSDLHKNWLWSVTLCRTIASTHSAIATGLDWQDHASIDELTNACRREQHDGPRLPAAAIIE
jgi:hypothetical protein